MSRDSVITELHRRNLSFSDKDADLILAMVTPKRPNCPARWTLDEAITDVFLDHSWLITNGGSN